MQKLVVVREISKSEKVFTIIFNNSYCSIKYRYSSLSVSLHTTVHVHGMKCLQLLNAIRIFQEAFRHFYIPPP